MARNTKVSDVLLMLKSEIGNSLIPNVGVAKDQEFYTLIDNKQKWLAGERDWPFMQVQADISVSTGVGARYQTFPTTVDSERPFAVTAFYSNNWFPVEHGIGTQEYNRLSSGDAGEAVFTLDPIQRWDWKQGDSTLIEIWPIPSTAQTLRFSGQKTLTALKSGSEYDPAATLDLDDLLVALFVASDLLSRMRKPDAQLKLTLAQQRLNRLGASYPSRRRSFVMGGNQGKPEIKIVSISSTA